MKNYERYLHFIHVRYPDNVAYFITMEENIQCGDFIFYNNFDSANLAKVEKVDVSKHHCAERNDGSKTNKSSTTSESPSNEFNLWTKHDCHGTEFENNNRTWFYFGIKSSVPGIFVKLNLVNLNKQLRMFSQGMSPVSKVIPGRPHWERIKEKPSFIGDEKSNEFVLSFTYRTPENSSAITYFAFTYPFSYTDLQNYLKKIDNRMLKRIGKLPDDIYYHKECAIKSLEGRRLDVLTISSYCNILPEREARIKGLYPMKHEKRAHKFQDKKVIFLSARVHPGETPSSFVLNGFINFILNREDAIAITLRRLYVFKLIPMLNPDGVAHGFYRMDTKGVNLNRLYLNPSKSDHPTIFAARNLIRYYHNGYNLPEEVNTEGIKMNNATTHEPTSIDSNEDKIHQKGNTTLEEQGNRNINCSDQTSEKPIQPLDKNSKSNEMAESVLNTKINSSGNDKKSANDSGLFLYVDFHGHASKKGIFMYGNYFNDAEDAAACMLLPKLLSLNNPNFHFTSCNFAEKNMYLIDKRDGLSREGSGRVAVYKLTGLINSYTLECNYNTGRLVNNIPLRSKEGFNKFQNQILIPPKYSPAVFEEVGAALGPSILDMTGCNPNSRLPNSHYRSLKALQAYLKLISSSNYQATINKPLNKNNAGDQLHFCQDPMVDNLVTETKYSTSPNKDPAPKDIPCQKFGNDSLIGCVKKIKSNKRHSQIEKRNIPKLPTGKQNSSPHKQIDMTGKPKYSGRNNGTNKGKSIEQKISAQSSRKKITVSAKRTMMKKQGGKKFKTMALSKMRHQFQMEFGESSLNNVLTLVASSQDNKNNSQNIINKKISVRKNVEKN